CYCADRPHADQADFLIALDLVAQQHKLDENRRHQRREVAVAIENQIHNNNCVFLFHVFIQRRYSTAMRRNSANSVSILPVPSTTEASGSSAIDTGNPVSWRMRLSRFLISAPPPVSTMPRSLISAESSGGVRSRATRMAFRMV